MVGTRVYVGGLSYRVGERDLDRFFRSYGRLRDIVIKNGFGFVEFDDDRDADEAVYEMNGKELLGERVTVEKARSAPRMRWPRAPPPREFHSSRFGMAARTDYRLTAENLSSRVSWQDLKDFMRQAGEVTYAAAHEYRRNEGVVEFATYADMKNALHRLDGKELHGRRIHLVDESKSRSSRSRSRSSSRSRSRSRSRTRSRSRSHSRSHSRSLSRSGGHSKKRRSKSKSRSKSGSRSRSRSGSERSKSRSRSRSRSHSPTPEKRKSRSRSKSAAAETDSEEEK
ncbi:serine-arginine protein 55-like [Procambarus clarkii]|uniref:serine-arginine protein 55-like n=1 Tax=Procambarus clarkii TaxID=6728 RepID=UPI00374379F2